VLAISLDPARDSPAALAALAARHGLDTPRWTLARAANGDVRRVAAALGVRYRMLPDGEINHSTVIALLDADGRIMATTATVGRVDDDFAARVREAVTAAPQ
jgi:protein SCO1/2